ncbi:MAG: hypothetical protein ACK4MH_11265 [Brevundimonas sp.]|uniref:hypothetical protein n=1 Tax=Brevundimonas sp. TaxID=1871086 RepID=UPI003919A149
MHTHAKLIDVLYEGVWHATSVERFKAIMVDGFIRVRPPLHQYPNTFCQYTGRVSLFDFREAPGLFDAIERGLWLGFSDGIPGGHVVFLQVDPGLPVPTAASLVDEFNEARSRPPTGVGGSRLIAGLETGYTADIPIERVVRTFVWEPNGNTFSDVVK